MGDSKSPEEEVMLRTESVHLPLLLKIRDSSMNGANAGFPEITGIGNQRNQPGHLSLAE